MEVQKKIAHINDRLGAGRVEEENVLLTAAEPEVGMHRLVKQAARTARLEPDGEALASGLRGAKGLASLEGEVGELLGRLEGRQGPRSLGLANLRGAGDVGAVRRRGCGALSRASGALSRASGASRVGASRSGCRVGASCGSGRVGVSSGGGRVGVSSGGRVSVSSGVGRVGAVGGVRRVRASAGRMVGWTTRGMIRGATRGMVRGTTRGVSGPASRRRRLREGAGPKGAVANARDGSEVRTGAARLGTRLALALVVPRGGGEAGRSRQRQNVIQTHLDRREGRCR